VRGCGKWVLGGNRERREGAQVRGGGKQLIGPRIRLVILRHFLELSLIRLRNTVSKGTSKFNPLN
jgi:hypothetical protein